MSAIDDLVQRYVDDPSSMGEADLDALIAALREQPRRAVQLREQLILDDLLGQKLALDRRNFIAQVEQRLEDFERGEEETYDQVAELRAIAESEIEQPQLRTEQTPWLKISLAAAAAVLLIVAGFAWRYRGTESLPVANVEELSGQVVCIHLGKEEPLRAGQAVSTGDKFIAAAGSSLVWTYKDGTKVRILGDTTAQITAERGTLAKRVSLEQGEMVASVQKQKRGAMIFTTPHAAATVRGTELRLVVNEGTTLLDVTEGIVDLQRHGGGQTIQVTANETGVASEERLTLKQPQWPLNRDGIIYLFEGGNLPQLARNPETGNLRVTPLEVLGQAAVDAKQSLAFSGGNWHSDEAGHDMLPLLRESGRFSVELACIVHETDGTMPQVILAYGAEGTENLLLWQQGDELLLSLHRAGGDALAEFSLGKIVAAQPLYVSIACQDGLLLGSVNGETRLENGEFSADISNWGEGPLVLGSTAGGNKAWKGEISALAIYDQFVDRELAAQNRQRLKMMKPQ